MEVGLVKAFSWRPEPGRKYAFCTFCTEFHVPDPPLPPQHCKPPGPNPGCRCTSPATPSNIEHPRPHSVAGCRHHLRQIFAPSSESVASSPARLFSNAPPDSSSTPSQSPREPTPDPRDACPPLPAPTFPRHPGQYSSPGGWSPERKPLPADRSSLAVYSATIG